MAFKLDKQELTRRDQFISDIREQAGKLEDAINVYNAAVLALRGPLDEAIASYNALIAEAQGFAEDIGSRADSEIEDKSERWQESDKGNAAAEWRDAWQNASLTEFEIDYPEDISTEITDAADELEELPTEAES